MMGVPDIVECGGNGIDLAAGKRVKQACTRTIGFLGFLLLFPLLLMPLAALLAQFLTLTNDISFIQGFLHASSSLLIWGSKLEGEDMPGSGIGATAIEIGISILGILVFGLFVTLVSLFQVPKVIYLSTGVCFWGKTWRIMLSSVIIVPSIFVTVSLPFGAILAHIEAWSIGKGLVYSLGSLIGLGTSLSGVKPQSVTGRTLDLVFSSFAMGLVSLVVDFLMIVNPGRRLYKGMKKFISRSAMYDDHVSAITSDELSPSIYLVAGRDTTSVADKGSVQPQRTLATEEWC